MQVSIFIRVLIVVKIILNIFTKMCIRDRSFTGELGIAGGDYLYIYDYNGKLIQEISLGQIYQDHKTAFACHIAFCDAGKVYVYVDATVSGIYSAAYSSNTVQELSLIHILSCRPADEKRIQKIANICADSFITDRNPIACKSVC